MPSNEPEFRYKVNIRCETGGVFVDLNAGGGMDPAVIAYSNDTYKTNPNQIWEIYSVPGFDTRVVIKNSGNKAVLYSTGSGRRVGADKGVNVWDAAAQWYLEGGQIGDIKDDTIIRLRNVRDSNSYLDLEGGVTKNLTPFLTYPGHGGQNQSFKLWRR
ncbi:hypothetical protein ACJ41O_000020 [Fusarium nematophilum]